MIVPSFQLLEFDRLDLSCFLRALEFGNPLTALSLANGSIYHVMPSEKFNITHSIGFL
jgi:hypothetical protein